MPALLKLKEMVDYRNPPMTRKELIRMCAEVVEEEWQAYVKTEEWVTTEGNFLDWFADLLEDNDAN